MNSPQVVQFTVDEEDAGQRLDNFLFRLLKGVPKTHIYRIVRSGEVRVNKGRVGAEHKIAMGDLIRVPPVRVSYQESPDVTPTVPGREFPLLFEDDVLLAIQKPAGVAVHGGSGVSFGVIEQLRQARPKAKFLELIHRLDRETSGVLLIAKKRSALRHIQDQFRDRSTGKTYLTLVKGDWPVNKKVLDQSLKKYLLPDGERRVKVVPQDHPDGMRSITLVQVAARMPDPVLGGHSLCGICSLLEVTIKTGRTHQIRVHLAHSGHVIAGDDKYGDFEWNRLLSKAGHKRMFLHAWKLSFLHPVTHVAISLLAPLPEELENMLSIQCLEGKKVAPAQT